MKSLVTTLAILLVSVLPLRAQFYVFGNDPASTRWSVVETPTYKVIYPRGLDSLARAYAFRLEQAAGPVGEGTGYRSNSAYRKKWPVILHAQTAYSNGMVTIPPRRLELLTRPEAYSPIAMPWEQMLAIHESRHISQMQFANTRGYKALNVLVGQLATAGISAAFCGLVYDEGDAVVAETALSKAGRGRSADFLEYYRASFADGQYRNWWQWRYGSQKHFTPDYYKLGYISIAGIRTLYDEPMFSKRMTDRIFEHKGIVLNNLHKNMKEISGLPLRKSFEQICAHLDSTWKADAKARAPFTNAVQFSKDERLFTEYRSLVDMDGNLLAVRSGIAEAPVLARLLPDGSAEKISAFSSSTSDLRYSPLDNRIYWSEYTPDPVWSLASTSSIRYLDKDGHTGTLTRGYFHYNPAPSPTEHLIAVTEYPAQGGSRICLVSSEDGSVQKVFIAPNGLQLTESAWLDERLFSCGLSEEGFGIYEVTDGFRCVLSPVHMQMARMMEHDGKLMFTADLGGVQELYSLSPDGNNLCRLTSNPNGGKDFTFMDGRLYYSVLGSDGRKVMVVDEAELQPCTTSISDAYVYAMAEALSADEPGWIDPSFSTEISEPRNYSKLGNLISVHSWAPVYFEFDSVSEISMESIYKSAGAGALVFFQNNLSTFSGNAGIKIQEDTRGWRPSGHLKLTYTGFFPAVELSADINEGTASSTIFSKDEEEGIKSNTSDTGRPYINVGARVYAPLNLSSGGWQRGIIPQIRYSITNNRYQGELLTKLSGNIRAYTMRPVPSSGIYPRTGIGVEIGASSRPGLSRLFTSNLYGYVYGYLPGIVRTHGIRISAMAQTHLGEAVFADPFANIAPRGFGQTATRMVSAYEKQAKLSFDYALPFGSVDWTWLCPVAYIRNFELTPHADLTLFSAPAADRRGSLYSVGTDLAAHLGNIVFLPFDTRIGVRYDYNGGSIFTDIPDAERHFFSMLFSMDF